VLPTPPRFPASPPASSPTRASYHVREHLGSARLPSCRISDMISALHERPPPLWCELRAAARSFDRPCPIPGCRCAFWHAPTDACFVCMSICAVRACRALSVIAATLDDIYLAVLKQRGGSIGALAFLYSRSPFRASLEPFTCGPKQAISRYKTNKRNRVMLASLLHMVRRSSRISQSESPTARKMSAGVRNSTRFCIARWRRRKAKWCGPTNSKVTRLTRVNGATSRLHRWRQR